MTLKLRRPARSANRPRFAEGGGVSISPTPPITRVEDRPEPAHTMAARALRGAGVGQPTAPQKALVAQAVARDRAQGGGNTGAALAQAARMHEPGSSVPPHIMAALDLRPPYARGGSIAPGLPAAPFASIPTPSIATPGLASPRALTSAHHRTHFAAGGAIPAHIMAALALRPHFDDGGDAGGGGDSSHSSSSSSSGGDGGGDNSGDGHGSSSDSSSSSSSSGSAGGVGGFGGGGSDGYGGGSSSSSSSVGGHSDASTGGADSSPAGGSSSCVGSSSVGSTTSSGGFSSGAASGADSGDGGSVGSGSSAVGSIGGSYGAPAAGGFSNEGAPATGGFGNFGATPSATTSAGLTGATPSASMMSGQTASQSMANEAANSAGEAGEDGTAGLGAAPSTGQAFANFGPAPASPYGSLANAQQSFGAQPDGTTGTVPGSVAASNIGALDGLSPSATQFGMMGPSGVDASQVSAPAGFTSPGAYGLSTEHAPGFDNFNSNPSVSSINSTARGDVTASSLGSDGYTGGFGYGVQSAVNGSLSGPEGYVGGTPGMPASVTAALAATPSAAERGYSPEAIGGMFGDVGNIFGGVVSPAEAATPATAPSPYGTLSKTPMGPLTVGPLSAAMSPPTSARPGLNADADPVSVGGVSALTIHGPMAEAAQGAYDAPGAPTPFGGITDQQAFNARQSIQNGTSTPADEATASGYTAQQASPVSRTVGLGVAPASVAAAAPAATSLQAATDGAPADTSATAALAGLGTIPDATQPAPLTITAATPVSQDTIGDYTKRMQQFESQGVPTAVSPTGAYGLSQFTQGTWAGVARNNPDLGLPATPQQATPEQYSAATNALTNENVAAAVNAGLAPTFGTVYGFHVMGAPVAARALSQSDDTPIGQAGIPSSTIAANPAVFGGVQTVGDLKSNLASIMGTMSAPSDAMSTVGTFGLNQIAASVPTQPGNYGTTLAHDYSTIGAPSQGFRQAATTAHDAPGVTAFGGMAASYANADGTISNENMATPSSEQGYTDFSGNPVNFGSPAPSTTDTDTSTKHLSVPNFAGNAIGGMAASAVLGGPIGLGVGAANAVSGLLGGPTMADGINAVLAHPGAPSSVTGGGDNSNQPGSDSYGSAMPAPYDPGSPSTTAPAATTSTGVNPLDPHATATAAYEAALAGMGQPGPSPSAPGTPSDDAISGYRHALWIRGSGHHALNTAPASPVYNPMQDPSVLHALGLD